jgi:hypothetical protein
MTLTSPLNTLDVRPLKHLDVDEVPNCLIYDDEEPVLVRELSDGDKVGRTEERIRRVLAEKSEQRMGIVGCTGG